MNGRECLACGAALFEPHKPGCGVAKLRCQTKHEPDDLPEPSDNPFAEILSALRRIEEKLDRLAMDRMTATDAITVPAREYLTVAEAADVFNVSKAALYRLKRLHHHRGRSVRFRRSELALHLRASRAA